MGTRSSDGIVLKSYKIVCEKLEIKNCFFLFRKLSLLLILLITFKAIDSPETFSSIDYPRYVAIILLTVYSTISNVKNTDFI